MNDSVINEALLEEIELLELLVKNNTAGMFGGNHQSKTFGSSCEFADYRDYLPGDDITKIDWNAYARFETLYYKLFSDERQMHTRIYLDASRSMAYGEGGKAEAALRFAAAFAYLSVKENDRVSLYAVRNREVEEIAVNLVGRDAFLSNISKLNAVAFEGDSYLSEAILPTRVGYGDGTSILISDFLTENNYEDAIDYLVEKKRDVLCVQILSKEELNPKLRGKVHLFDSENADKVYRKHVDREIVRAYKMALEFATARIRDYCKCRGAEYFLASAEDSVSKTFLEKFVDVGVVK